ncbi:thioredoxin [Nanoarchaeota archaeon]
MAGDSVPELTNGEFKDFVSEGFVLVDFFAEWCMPCLMMSPVLDELSEKFDGRIKFGKINVEENSEIAQKFNVSSIPNLVLLKDGEVVDSFVGAISAEDLEEKLRGYL